jgi:DNA-binding MarR family transcriptional regulator/GNAT superfamily N-acetyltransferase
MSRSVPKYRELRVGDILDSVNHRLHGCGMTRIPAGEIDAVRRFNRLYTLRVGALGGGHLGSKFSLTEVRVLYEIANRTNLSASRLTSDLGIDAGYLSRILRRFERMKLLVRKASPGDGRMTYLQLTRAGKAVFAPLNRKAEQEVASLLGALQPDARRSMLGAMHRISTALESGARSRSSDDVVLRDPRPGDLGWVVYRHGVLYADEYNYNAKFEAIVARIVADFVDTFDAACERCWIAERDGETVGSVFLVRKTATVAKLRLLYVEPSARGIGLGRRLVDECIAFARKAGYRKITLWTQSSLAAARHIYRAAGFELRETTKHADFGPREAAEIWELSLKV